MAWDTTSVNLIGILSEKDLLLSYGAAILSLAHPNLKIQETMEPSNFLVFRSAEHELDDVATTLNVQAKSDARITDVTNADERNSQIDKRQDDRPLAIAAPERNEPVGAGVPATLGPG